MKTNQIQICDDIEMSIYPNVAYPLLLIRTEAHLSKWYYESFINIYSQCWSANSLRIDFLDSSRFFGDILDRQSVTIPEARNINIIAFIKECIDSGFCINVFALEEYYLKGSEYFQKRHAVHETFVYGYNDIEEIINVIGYNKDGMFTKLCYSYDDFLIAFAKAIENPPNYLVDALHKVRIRNFFCDYDFSLLNFCLELKNYLYSLPDTRKKYFSLASADKVLYGLSVYKEVQNQLNNALTGNNSITLSYLVFHFMFEHKKIILNRLKFVSDNFDFDDTSILLKNYQEICNIASSIRIYFLKAALSESEFQNRYCIKNIKVLKKIKSGIDEILNLESDILMKYLAIIDEYIKKNPSSLIC